MNGKQEAIMLLIAACLAAGGCVRLYFWAGEHELTVPPEPEKETTPTPLPDIDLRA